MSLNTQRTVTDPLGSFIRAAAQGKVPVPLVSTEFDVVIEAGLAMVVTKRVFRNQEHCSIEATMTFPVPTGAILFDLEAKIDGRRIRANARRQEHARSDYEGAIDDGKFAVLHEELLRGLHMLSVGHLRPGGEIELTSRWATTLTMIGERGCLRIPLTVGDIYGRSGLQDVDEILIGGPVQTGKLTVHCSDGRVELMGARLSGGKATVALNAPIDLAITDWQPRTLRGRAADRRDVLLRVEPNREVNGTLNVAVLIDHSGSMNEPCVGSPGASTKHQAVKRGLKHAAAGFGPSDMVDLWEFNDKAAQVDLGSRERSPGFRHGRRGARAKATELIERLSEPAGGTEIGSALRTVIAKSDAKDLLLITDGKSHALDVQALAQAGRRISVVLVGEDSLEAKVGHLAALTGGQIFVVAGAELGEAIATALATLRIGFQAPEPIAGELRSIRATRGNAVVTAEWCYGSEACADPELGRAIAAVAADLALPALSSEAGTGLAIAEGLVTHLTSLVLVDEEGEIQDGIPITRKIALPMPSMAYACLRPEAAYEPPLGDTLDSISPRLTSWAWQPSLCGPSQTGGRSIGTAQ